MITTKKETMISTHTQSVNGDKKLVLSGVGQAIIKEDAFLTWLSLMEVYGITENKELAARLNDMSGTKYRHWELTRWKRQTRGVPKEAHNFMSEEILYWLLSGDCLMPKGKCDVKDAVVKMMKQRDSI